MTRRTHFSLTLLLLSCLPAVASEKPTAEQLEFFETKIRPVLVTHCYECHSGKVKEPKGGLRLDTRQALLAGGDSGATIDLQDVEQSLLLNAIRFEDLEMPPKGKLPEAVIADVARWLKMGAPDPRKGPSGKVKKSIDYQQGLRFWAFQSPKRRQLPKVKNGSWPRNDIDHFVLSRLEKAGLSPAPPADRRALIRRAYFDLIGLPPTPEQVETFANDKSPDAFVELVDHLLASKHYGERWGRHWLDIARYAEDQAHTFKARNYPRGYYYRDWVIRSLNEDMPYDRFLLYQIAGDLLDEPDRHERIAALGLFALGPVYYQDNGEKAKALADEWDDRVDTLMRGVLGLTAACARCHDHKYDPISTADYYGLAGIFASTDYKERPIVSEEVLQQRSKAENRQKELQLMLDRYLAEQAKLLRDELVSEIPQYVEHAWLYHNKAKAVDGKKKKKLLSQVAKRAKLSEELLKRWHAYLIQKKSDARRHLEDWAQLLADEDAKKDMSEDEKQRAKVREQGRVLQERVARLLPRKQQLFKRFGDNVAFVKPEERADVPPGVIPLGNLFDDSKGTSLDAAISSDRFGAAASAKTLGVERIIQGCGERVQVAPGVNFNLAKLGSDGSSHGSICNDAWNTGGGIRTTGRRSRDGKRLEQGVGMHANALITFDLAEIRSAGLLPPDQKFVFSVRRAGINDDTFGSKAPSAHLAVIVSRPHAKQNVFDAILSGQVNGKPLSIAENDTVYYFSGEEPKPLKADGRFVSFATPIPADARYLTLVATGAGEGADGNSINSDHTVFSGAQLTLDPLPQVAEAPPAPETEDGADEVSALAEAVLLSEFFYDTGLLALPPREAETRLKGAAAKRFGQLRKDVETQKKVVEAIETPAAHALDDGKGRDLKIYLQGDPTKQGPLAPRAFPAIFTGGQRRMFQTQGSGRLELARAVVDPNNPLTARVIINRIWRGHFGRGLVATPSNFGQLGDRPSHPDLLDHLAVQLVGGDWSLKAVHREIMLSATYQQSSDYQPSNYAVDPDNRLLWRMNRRRLEVEPWRDAILTVSGKLDEEMGGPPVNLDDAKNTRRTVYGFVSRHRLNELLRLFDFPDPNITSAKRSATTVPLQQLFVLNSDFMIDQARALAARLEKERGTDVERLERAFLLLFGRKPNDSERDLALKFLSAADNKHDGDKLSAWQQYALALLGSNEFAFID